MFVVNRALAYKWSGDDKKAREIIGAEDWSDTRDKFRLAEAVILENYPKAFELMREIGKDHKEIPKIGYRTWPLFKALRTTPEFLETYEKIFGEPFNKVTAEDLENAEKGDVHLPEELESETEITQTTT